MGTGSYQTLYLALNSIFLELDCKSDADCKEENQVCDTETETCVCDSGFTADPASGACIKDEGRLCHVVREIAQFKLERVPFKHYTWSLIPYFQN